MRSRSFIATASLSLFMMCAFHACKKRQAPTPIKRIIDFSHSGASCIDSGIQFSEDSTLLAAPVMWDLGDGAKSDQHRPVHHYAAAGTYTVTLIVPGDTVKYLQRTITVTACAPYFSKVCRNWVGDRKVVVYKSWGPEETYLYSNDTLKVVQADPMTIVIQSDTLHYNDSVTSAPGMTGMVVFTDKVFNVTNNRQLYYYYNTDKVMYTKYMNAGIGMNAADTFRSQ